MGSTLEQVLDKYGPMALALFVVSMAFLLFVYKVLPLSIGQMSQTLKDLIGGLNEIAGHLRSLAESLNSRMESIEKRLHGQKTVSKRRHEEIMQRLTTLRDKNQSQGDKTKEGDNHAT